MRRTIDRILEGNFSYESGSLDFSCSKIELSLEKGQIYEGTFTLQSILGTQTRGYVTTSDVRMECLTPTFAGSNEEIAFCFHGEHLEEGDIVEGEFHVISNQGEYILPFIVTIEYTLVTSSEGNIKNLFQFVNLAKNNWMEAVRLFYTPEFSRVFVDSDRHYYERYRSLAAGNGREHNVEEFLVEINKKLTIEYVTEESELILDNPTGTVELALTIVRNGWGHTYLEVFAEGDFVKIEKEVITELDFLGNYYRLPIYVDAARLRDGKNFGRVTLWNHNTNIVIPVIVKKSGNHLFGTILFSGKNTYIEEKRIMVQTMEFYQAFRMKKISKTTWLTETKSLVEQLCQLDDKNVAAKLFQAQLLITEERYQEGSWLLDQAIEVLERNKEISISSKQVLRAYYLYLTTLVNRNGSYVDKVAEEVEHLYRQNHTNWRIAWLLLYLSKDFYNNPVGKWNFIEKQMKYGCTSPIMYNEALILLGNNPTLLRKLGEFELQILLYGAKEDILSAPVMEQFLYLTGKVKKYSSLLLRILIRCYEIHPVKEDNRVLHEIISLLIKGGKTERKYFQWFRLGVENGLRITKLYEYYMASIPLNETEQEIPKIVLMYFSYQSSLDYEHSAYLYSYVVQRREEYQELYANYREKIERFIIEQIQKEHINSHLAYLYEELLTPSMINEQTAPAFAKLMFAHEITVRQQGICNAIVYQAGCLEEKVYPIADGHVWVPLYGDTSTLLFEDGAGHRYISNVEYSVEPLLYFSKYIRMVMPFVEHHLELNLYLCESNRQLDKWTTNLAKRALWLMKFPNILPEIKRDYTIKLLEYYYDNDDVRGMDSFLNDLHPSDFTRKEQKEVLRYLVMRGKLEQGMEWFAYSGTQTVELKTLVYLCSERMVQTEFVEDSVLLSAASYLFRTEKYDGNILRYLISHFKGTTKEMRDIWKCACAFDVDSYLLCEKILVQMLFSGAEVSEKSDIFKTYVSKGAKPKLEEAMLAQYAYEYFVKEKDTDSYVFDCIYKMYIQKGDIPQMCSLAFVKFYGESVTQGRQEAYKSLVREYMNKSVQEGIYLKCFQKVKGCSDILYPILDRTIVEYRSHPDTRVKIHYVITQEGREASDYLAEEMKKVCPGVFVKDFILFFGESLEYYIVEIKDEGEELVKNGTIQKTEDGEKIEHSRYELLDDMAISKSMEDYDTMDTLLEDYFRKTQLNDKLFLLR